MDGEGFEQSCRWCGEKDRISSINHKWESYQCENCDTAMDGLTDGGQNLMLILLKRIQSLEGQNSKGV